jgi:hypothetical protein
MKGVIKISVNSVGSKGSKNQHLGTGFGNTGTRRMVHWDLLR